MFISKKHISRRTILKGAGATLALPLLDAALENMAHGLCVYGKDMRLRLNKTPAKV